MEGWLLILVALACPLGMLAMGAIMWFMARVLPGRTGALAEGAQPAPTCGHGGHGHPEAEPGDERGAGANPVEARA